MLTLSGSNAGNGGTLAIGDAFLGGFFADTANVLAAEIDIIPEPGSPALATLGIAAAGALHRRRRHPVASDL